MDPFLIHIFLLSIRLLPILVIMPIMPFDKAPILVRLILSLVLSVILVTGMTMTHQASLNLLSIMSEFFLGMMIAFGFHLAVASLDFVGKLIDLQIGLNSSGVFNPSTSTVMGIVSELLIIAYALMFLSLDVHHQLLKSMSIWLSLSPLGELAHNISITSLVSIMSEQFLLAFIMMLPVIIALWLIDIAFALMSKSMPQANIYFLALPVKLMMGVMMLLVTMPMTLEYMSLLFEKSLALGTK